MSKYNSKEEAYFAYFDRMINFIINYYDCQITYPENVWDLNSMTDGLTLKFNKINWNCFVSNHTMSQIFFGERYVGSTICFKGMRTLIENMLLEKLKK